MQKKRPDGVLIDVTGLTLDQQLAEADESALDRALARILSSSEEPYNGFQASI